MMKLMTIMFLMTFSVGVMAQSAPDVGQDEESAAENLASDQCRREVAGGAEGTQDAAASTGAAAGGASQEGVTP
jgi:hypothetical protein